MVRNVTTNKQGSGLAQWYGAWDLLTFAQRRAVAQFCVAADADVAAAAIRFQMEPR